MPEPTVEEVLNIDKQPQKAQASAIGAVLAFFLFAPLGVYLLWKEKTFHRTFALLTLIFGSGYLVSTLLTYSIGIHFLLISFVVLISIFQVYYSLVLYRKARRTGYLEVSELTVLAVFVLFVDFILIPLIISWLVIDFFSPIFKQVIEQNQLYNLPTE